MLVQLEPRRTSAVRDRFSAAARRSFSVVPEGDWNDWRWQQRARLRTLEEVGRVVCLTAAEERAFSGSAAAFEVAITPYYAALIDPGDPTCPIRLQAVPQAGELDFAADELVDPLGEEKFMPVPGLTHRYPDRVLLYATHNCPVYCRHCLRKRKVSAASSAPDHAQLDGCLSYIAAHPEVRDVIVSGGDPLTLSDERLESLLGRLRAVAHVEIIRLATRNLVTLPQRITPDLAQMLAQFHPLFVHTHFNHPKECTREAFDACALLADAGCVLNNQMVLLQGINDDASVVTRLNQLLLMMRVRPYYIFQADPAPGTRHFRTPVDKGLEIIRALRGHTSGLAVPHFVIDGPGGGGKMPLLPSSVEERRGKLWLMRNYRGELFEYWDP